MTTSGKNAAAARTTVSKRSRTSPGVEPVRAEAGDAAVVVGRAARDDLVAALERHGDARGGPAGRRVEDVRGHVAHATTCSRRSSAMSRSCGDGLLALGLVVVAEPAPELGEDLVAAAAGRADEEDVPEPRLVRRVRLAQQRGVLGPHARLLRARVPRLGVLGLRPLADPRVSGQRRRELVVAQLERRVVGLLPQRVGVGVRPRRHHLVHPSGHAEAAGDEVPCLPRRQSVELCDPHHSHASHCSARPEHFRQERCRLGCVPNSAPSRAGFAPNLARRRREGGTESRRVADNAAQIGCEAPRSRRPELGDTP